MGKYSKLGDYLAASKADIVHLTFDQIEAIVGTALPPSKAYPAWWSNSPWNNVMTKVWLDAGFKSSRVDVSAGTVDFIRTRQQVPAASAAVDAEHALPRSPLFGFMKGTTVVAPGVDLTAPADPDWAKVYDDTYVPPAAQGVVADPRLGVSAKIRELHAMGISRAMIAKLLNKRYQHVRNVLIADQRKAG
jgi:hypothetical protein